MEDGPVSSCSAEVITMVEKDPDVSIIRGFIDHCADIQGYKIYVSLVWIWEYIFSFQWVGEFSFDEALFW